MNRSKALGLVIGVVVLVLAVWPAVAQAAVMERVSVNSAEEEGDMVSVLPSISGDGRYVAFESDAENLVAGDENGVTDIFVRDRQTGETTRVSVATGGGEADGRSFSCWISANGEWVSFTSEATNLVPGDTNGLMDIFVHNRLTHVTTRVSVASNGTEADDESIYSSMSGDGTWVGFESLATNLVAGDTNADRDVFVHNTATHETQRVSIADNEAEGDYESYWVALSQDGRFVAFCSWADNLVAGDSNNSADIFVRDRTAGTTERVSVDSDGAEADFDSDFPSISADGRFVAFDSGAGNLVAGDGDDIWDVFVHDRDTGDTWLASANKDGTKGDDWSIWPAISADGRYVTFESGAENLVSWDTYNDVVDYASKGEIFVVDGWTGSVSDVCVTPDWSFADYWSGSPAITADGRYIAFMSFASNLVAYDTNDVEDAFVAINPLTLDYSSIRGSDRYDTAVRISKALYPAALPAGAGLVVATGETFQQALCGAPLAAAWGGPVLLTYASALTNTTKTELQRLRPTQVFCIGLTSAAVTQVTTAAKGVVPSATVTAIGGANVYEMSRNVANKLEEKVGDMTGATAIVTIGTNFPDAIGVSPLACSKLWPVVLTDKPDNSALHASAAGVFTDLGITRMLKVGTYAALPAGVTGVGSLSGSDRYFTNANVANWAKASAGLAFTHIAMATGDKFPDALASGPYLAKDDGILLLSPLTGPVPNPIKTVIAANAASVYHISYIACIEPVISQVLMLLP